MHVLKKSKLGRRHVLRGLVGGATVAIGLPPLEAMLGGPRRAAAREALPRRFISFLFGNGVQLQSFEPAETGPDWTPSGHLQPLADAGVKDHVTVCTGMRNRTTAEAVTHHAGMTLLSGYDFIPSNAALFASDWGGPTIDQVIADIIAAQTPTPVRSMQVGVSKFDSPVDAGTAARALSARGQPGSVIPLFPEHSPRQVWSNLFGEFEQPKDDRDLRLSILDATKADIDALNAKLGTQDRQRLEAHLQGVGELETKISALPPVCQIPGQPTAENNESNGQEQLATVNQLMSELIVYAFSCDLTRVASNLFCSIASESVFGDTPASDTHHVHSHANDLGYRQNIDFIISCFAQLLATLRDTQDAEGESLLDSTLVLATSEVSHGWTHSFQRQPIMIGGSGRNHLRYPGVHYQAVPRSNPLDDVTAAGNTTDILLTLARAFDPSIPAIGGGAMMSNSVLPDIMA